MFTASVFVDERDLQPCQAYTSAFLLSVTTKEVLDLKEDELQVQKKPSSEFWFLLEESGNFRKIPELLPRSRMYDVPITSSDEGDSA